MLTELDRYGKVTPELLENLNLRLAQSVTARNALGMSEKEDAREIATMLYDEVRPSGQFSVREFRAYSTAGVLSGVSQVHEHR
jgi:hypothetical protein